MKGFGPAVVLLALGTACSSPAVGPRLAVELVLPDRPDPHAEVATLEIDASWDGGFSGLDLPFGDGGVALSLPGAATVDVTVLGHGADGETLWRGVARSVVVPAGAGPAVARLFFGKIGAFSSFASVAEMPRLAGSAAVSWGEGRVLVSGGRGADGGPTSGLWLYDHRRVHVQAAGSGLMPRGHHLALATEDSSGSPLLFLAGGDGPVDTVEVVAADGGVWPLPPLVSPQREPAGAVTGDGVVLVGCGREGSPAVDVYRPADGDWEGSMPLPSRCVAGEITFVPGLGAVVGDGAGAGEISLLGGGSPEAAPAAGGVEPFATALTVRQSFGAVAVDGGIVQFGGDGDGGTAGDSEWHVQGRGSAGPFALLTPRADFATLLLPDGRLLVVGGRGADGSALATAELIDPVGGQVVAAGSLAGARIHPALAEISGYGAALVVSGEEADGSPVGGLEIYTCP